MAGGSLPLAESIPINAETLTSSGTSQQGTIVASNTSTEVWHVKAVSGAMWVAFGASPTATTTTDIHLAEGETYECSASVVDEKIAVIDA